MMTENFRQSLTTEPHYLLVKWDLENLSSYLEEHVESPSLISTPFSSSPLQVDFRSETPQWALELACTHDLSGGHVALYLHSLNYFTVEANFAFSISRGGLDYRLEKESVCWNFEGLPSRSEAVEMDVSDIMIFFKELKDPGDRLTVTCKFTSIKYDDFQKDSLLSCISGLKEKSDFCDTIVTGSENSEATLAHRAILSGRSGVLAKKIEMTKADGGPQYSVTLPDVDGETLKEMLQFIYCGAISDKLPDDRVKKLLVAANTYEVVGLEDLCVNHLCKNMNNDNTVDLIKFADKHNVYGLEEKAMEYFTRHRREIVEAEGRDCIMKLPQNFKDSLLHSLIL